MSEYKKKKAIDHKVIHEFSGRSHFYKVINKDKSEYNVSIQIGCDCTYMGVQGIARRKMCSHVLAVMKEIVDKGQITLTTDSSSMIRLRRNACMSLVRQSNRMLNEVRVSSGESKEHMDKKVEICRKLMQEGKHYITEAIFEDGSGKADILVLDEFKAIEIVRTEKPESIQEKVNKYPNGIKLEVVRC